MTRRSFLRSLGLILTFPAVLARAVAATPKASPISRISHGYQGPLGPVSQSFYDWANRAYQEDLRSAPSIDTMFTDEEFQAFHARSRQRMNDLVKTRLRSP